MRVVIGCLAAIGLVVVLLVAGCAGLVGIAFTLADDIPPYATREAIQRRHAGDLALIQAAIDTRDYSHLQERLSPAVLAIYRDDAELLRRHALSGKSYTIVNGGGVGTLTAKGRTVACEVTTLETADAPLDDYVVFFVDRQRGAGEPQVERP